MNRPAFWRANLCYTAARRAGVSAVSWRLKADASFDAKRGEASLISLKPSSISNAGCLSADRLHFSSRFVLNAQRRSRGFLPHPLSVIAKFLLRSKGRRYNQSLQPTDSRSFRLLSAVVGPRLNFIRYTAARRAGISAGFVAIKSGCFV